MRKRAPIKHRGSSFVYGARYVKKPDSKSDIYHIIAVRQPKDSTGPNARGYLACGAIYQRYYFDQEHKTPPSGMRCCKNCDRRR